MRPQPAIGAAGRAAWIVGRNAPRIATERAERERREAEEAAERAKLASERANNPSQIDGPAVARSIIGIVATQHGITVAAMLSVRQSKSLTAARRDAMVRLRAETKLSTPQIARALNRKDHTTVVHGLQRAARLAAAEGRS